MQVLRKSNKLADVCYDIRGPVLEEARRLEEEGFRITKLNIGNPAAFGLNAPDEIIHDIIINMREAEAYCDAQGLFSARKAVMQDTQEQGIQGVTIDDIFIGNGVSELIVMAMQALLNNGHEVLIPAPDYPLWTAAVNLSGGKPVHYLCDEAANWNPDIKDMAKKISPRTRAIVVINPNNPTGAVYSRDVLEQIAELARRHGLLVFADEIYGKILYDEAIHFPFAAVAPDLMVLSFSGLSKAYRAAGLRGGWMVCSGDRSHATDYLEGLKILSNMRLCANVPAQFGIQTALGGYQSIQDLVLPGGRLRDQRDAAMSMIKEIPGLSCVTPAGALYCFVKVDRKRFNIRDDQKLVLDMLRNTHILTVHGRGFNWPTPDHFRVVFLPPVEEIHDAFSRMGDFFAGYRQE